MPDYTLIISQQSWKIKIKEWLAHSVLVLSNGERKRRKEGKHLALVRNQVIDTREKHRARNSPRFTPSDSLLPLLLLQSLLHKAAKVSF